MVFSEPFPSSPNKQNKNTFYDLLYFFKKLFYLKIFSNDDLACLEQSDDVDIEFAAGTGLACRLKKVVLYKYKCLIYKSMYSLFI
jgi:hypothetical protein